MSMSESRHQLLLSGQSAIARKVFEMVPIQECWEASAIYGALRSTSTAADTRTVRRCLGELKDQGLIREPRSGVFQRSPISIKAKSEPEMTLPASNTVIAIKKASPSALDALGQLSAEVVALGDDLALRLKMIAGRIEEVALSVEVEHDSNAEALGKLKQLQALLKGIAQ